MKNNNHTLNLESHKLNKLMIVGMLIFIINIFTLNTFISSLKIEVILLVIATLIIIFYYITTKSVLTIYKLDIMWFLFLTYFLFNILYQSNFMKIFYIDLLVFFVMFILILLVKVEAGYYKPMINIIFLLGIVYSLSILLQYFNFNLYSKLFLSFFSISEKNSILELYNNGRGTYTGITWQTAYVAGYLVYGIGALLFFIKERKKKSSKVISILIVPLFLIGVLLTGKRAHLLFMLIALVFTYLFSIEFKKIILRFIKYIFYMTIMVLTLISILTFYKPTRETPFIGSIYYKTLNTIEGIKMGNDVTSGRTILYDYAIELFNEAPILGIGWRGFSQLSSSIFGNDFGSHPHNIYIQLLTELGLIGFLLFLLPVTYTLFKTIKLLMNSKKIFAFDMRWKSLLQFSLYIQIFFILYGITGNLLTDHAYLLTWTFASMITISSMKSIEINKKRMN